jgi:hypothetical protein
MRSSIWSISLLSMRGGSAGGGGVDAQGAAAKKMRVDALVARTSASTTAGVNRYCATGRPSRLIVIRLPGIASSQAKTRIIWRRGNAGISALRSMPKPVTFFAVVNGKRTQVSRM